MDVIPVFSTRAQDVARAFSFTGATVPAASEMDRADQEVASRVAELEYRLSDADVDLETLAVKALSGKAADMKALRETLYSRQAVDTSAYRRAIRAATSGLRREADRKEWSQAELIKSMVPVARDHLNHVADTAVESLSNLAPSVKSSILNNHTMAARATRELDPSTATGHQVEACQSCEWAWGIITNTWGGAYERQALAIHRGRVTTLEAEDTERQAVERENRRKSTTYNPPEGAVRKKDHQADHAPRHGELDSHTALAVWANPQAMEAKAAGISRLEAIVLSGHGSVAGLLDPYGKDADELSARLGAYDSVRAWLQVQADKRSGKTHRHPGDYSRSGSQPLYRQAGYSSPVDALNAYRAK